MILPAEKMTQNGRKAILLLVIYAKGRQDDLSEEQTSILRIGEEGVQVMEKELFEELMASISEAGAFLRGEREPARVIRFEDATGGSTLQDPKARMIRDQLKLPRGQFASLIGVSERTVEGWEQGRRKPSGPALTLLRVAARHPESVLDTMRQTQSPLAPRSDQTTDR